MCGGYTVSKNIKKAALKRGIEGMDVNPRFNARPSQDLPVVLNRDPKKMQLVHWGIVPSWAKKQGKHTQLINARIESADKFTFKKDFEERRCLVFADGFFEWEKTGSGKQPHYFRLKSGEFFTMAGIWEEDEELKKTTFAILTMPPNALVKKVHDRMPAMLRLEDENKWLTPEKDIHSFLSSLHPYPAREMEEYKISREVNVPYNDFPELLEPK